MIIETCKLLQNNSGWLVNGKIGVTNDPEARGYAEVQAWIAEGNTPEAADPAPAPSSSTVALGDTKQWLINNPGARQIWELSIEDLEIEVIAQVEALYPNATQQIKNKERLARMSTYLLIRREAKQLGLANGL